MSRRQNYSRARQNNRKVQPIAGIEHRIYRARENHHSTIKVVCYNPTNPAHTHRFVDSIVHRYGRECGYITETTGTIAPGDARMEAAMARSRTTEYKEKSAKGRHEMQSMLECFALAHHPNNEYTVFLRSLQSDMERNSGQIQVTPTRRLMCPPDGLLLSFIYHLRDGDVDLSAATDGRIANLSR